MHFKHFSKNILWLSLAIFVLALVVRGLRLPTHLFFGFEQGRDALRIQSLIKLEDVMLVGPKTDIAGIFHGPWYYYLMTIPYFIGGGEPLVASFFLVVLGALLPVFIFIWWWEISKNTYLSLAAGLAAVFSFELITYSRWLSNVSPTLPLFTAAYYALWKYHRSQVGWWLVASATLMGLAAQFEIILTLWMAVALVLLVASRQLTLPALKYIVLAILGAAVWYLPLLVFNIKYDWLTITAISQTLTGEESHVSSNLLAALIAYGEMMFRLWHKTVVYLPTALPGLAAVLTAIGVYLARRHKSARWLTYSALIILVSTLPVIFFVDSLGLVQVYAGIGLAFLQLLAIGLWGWGLDQPLAQPRWQQAGLVLLCLLLLGSAARSVSYIWQDRDTFYRTIQDDLNYADQKRVLNYIDRHKPSDEPYFVKAFAIPYYQEEGWLYLHQQHIGDPLEPGANTMFVIIEEKVDPYWEAQWQKDLGETELVEEKMFGLLKVQWRRRI